MIIGSLKKLSLTIALMTLISSLTGCGYTFQGAGSVLPADVRKVYVPLVENASTEPGLSTTLTDSIRSEFERYGVITVVDSIEEADAVLIARIKRVRRATRTTTGRTDVALQYDSTMIVDANLRRVDGRPLWRRNDLTVSKAFGSSKDVVVTGSANFAESSFSGSDLGGLDSREVSRGQEGESLQALSDEVARTIYQEAVLPEF